MPRPSCVLLLASALLTPTQAWAQSDEAASLERRLAEMEAEIGRLSAELAQLRSQARAGEAPVPASPPASPATPATTIAWKGAPELTLAGGWTFKPRGRLQVDTAVVEAPREVAGNSLGWASEFRRAYLGAEGTVPGGFGYRIEADIADSSVNLTDVFLTYRASDRLVLTIGQHKPFGGFEELTSDLFTPLLERAAFSSAFGFERRVGLSGTYSAGDLMVQLGGFADNAAELSSDANDSHSVDGRVVFAPEVGGGRLHLGASAHWRDLGDAAPTVRYRARPFVHTTDARLVDTRAFSARGERNFGTELAYVRGPFHATVEGHILTALRPGLDDPMFWGGYAEVGLLVTPGDVTGYRNGTYDRIRPARPLSAGGIGAIQLNARFDHLDLNDGAIVGGVQDAAGLSAIWIPSEYVRFLLNYGHLWISDAAVPAGASRDYQVDAVGMRAQIDF